MTRTILVVDDRPHVCSTIKISLEMDGYRVIMAADTTAGWKMVLSEKPEILILGIDLPNTFEMLERLHTELPQPRPAVIALNTATSYVQKPNAPKRWYTGIDVDLPAPYHELPAFVKRIFNYNDAEIARENNSGADDLGGG